MNILIASDDNYISPSLALVKSLCSNCNEKIHVFYLYSKLKEKAVSQQCDDKQGKIEMNYSVVKKAHFCILEHFMN